MNIVGNDGSSIFSRGSKAVAPVEAKEKERCEHGVWLGDRCYQCVYETENPVAEPKPTLSTSTELLPCPFCGGIPNSGEKKVQDVDECYGYCYVECPHCNGSNGKPFCGVHGETSEEVMAAWNSRPQPDSSSIPDGQTFEEWYGNSYPVYQECATRNVTRYGIDPVEARQHKEAASNAWAAAKGQSNGR